MARETVKSLADEILYYLRNLTTAHEMQARNVFRVPVSLATAINYGDVTRVTVTGRAKLIFARDALAQWHAHQYRMSHIKAANCALYDGWPVVLTDSK